MAESTLSMTLDDFRREVGAVLSYGLVYATMTSDQKTRVDNAILRGERQFYNPPPVVINGFTVPHEWSFLRPITTITTSAPYSTGTISYDNTGGAFERLVELTGGTWPSWAADGNIEFEGVRYSVDTRESDTELTLSEGANPGEDIAASTSYELTRADMDLPDDFGGMMGDITLQSSAGYRHRVCNVGEAKIRYLRQISTRTNVPELFAIRPVNTDKGTSGGQRYELNLFPDPDAAYVLTYRYKVLPSAMSDTGDYPLAPMQHIETLLASCLAVAESMLEPAPPNYRRQEEFIERLTASVIMDQRDNTPDTLGYNGDDSDDRFQPSVGERTHQTTNSVITYNA